MLSIGVFVVPVAAYQEKYLPYQSPFYPDNHRPVIIFCNQNDSYLCSNIKK
jgi:hypothetical protein